MARALPIRLRTLAAAVVVIASGLMIFNAYQSIINSTDEPMATLPVIKADSEPFRVVPLTRGGMNIPNEGNTVFNLLKKNNDDALALGGIDIESNAEPIDLIEDTSVQGFELPEIPEPKTESLFDTALDPSIIDNPEVDALKEKLEQAIERVEERREGNESTSMSLGRRPQSIPDKNPEVDPEAQKNEDKVKTVVIPKSKPSKPRKITEKRDGEEKPPIKEFSLDRILSQDPIQKRHYIQLASLKSEADARAAYNRIRDQFPKLVEGVSVFFPQADLGARGVFTRIQIGPLDSAVARARCADYSTSSNGGTCLVISR